MLSREKKKLNRSRAMLGDQRVSPVGPEPRVRDVHEEFTVLLARDALPLRVVPRPGFMSVHGWKSFAHRLPSTMNETLECRHCSAGEVVVQHENAGFTARIGFDRFS